MFFKLLGTLAFISLYLARGHEAASATCDFGPMEGVEGKISIILAAKDRLNSCSQKLF